MSKLDKALSVLGLVLLALVLAIAFRAYLSPAMLLDLAALHICS